MDIAEIARAYRRRADAREAARVERYATMRQRAQQIAAELRRTYGASVRVYLIGSLLDPDRFRTDSDVDLVVEGLEPAEYWDAWRIVESLAASGAVDLVRLETAGEPLRERVRAEGQELQ